MSHRVRIEKSSFGKEKVFSRFEFLMRHLMPGKILDIGNLGRDRETAANDPFHPEWNAPMGGKIRDTAHEKSVVYGFDLFAPENPERYPNQTKGDIQEGLPYEDLFFDTVYMGELIEHLDMPGKVLDEIYRVLAPNGVFILDTPNPYSFTEMAKYVLLRVEDLCEPSHLLFYTPASLQAMLEAHHFEITELNTKLPKFLRPFPSTMVRGLGTHLLIAAKKK